MSSGYDVIVIGGGAQDVRAGVCDGRRHRFRSNAREINEIANDNPRGSRPASAEHRLKELGIKAPGAA